MMAEQKAKGSNTVMDDVFKALADPIRRSLLETLGKRQFFCSVEGEPVNGICVQDLSTLLSLPQSTVSRHLRILGQAQLVNHDRKGTWHYYFCNQETIRDVQAWLGDLQTNIEPTALLTPEKSDIELDSTGPVDRP